MDQSDGNLAALRKYEQDADEADEVLDSFSEEATEELVTELLDGETIRSGHFGWTLFDLIENEQFANHVVRIINADTDELVEIQGELRGICERAVRKWVASDVGQEIVADRCWEQS